MVRFFGLERTLKYKRSPVANRRREFRRYREHLAFFLDRHWPDLLGHEETRRILATGWSKPDEDRLDAFFCAVIGGWHLRHDGNRSEVLGDPDTGQILVPKPIRTRLGNDPAA